MFGIQNVVYDFCLNGWDKQTYDTRLLIGLFYTIVYNSTLYHLMSSFVDQAPLTETQRRAKRLRDTMSSLTRYLICLFIVLSYVKVQRLIFNVYIYNMKAHIGLIFISISKKFVASLSTPIYNLFIRFICLLLLSLIRFNDPLRGMKPLDMERERELQEKVAKKLLTKRAMQKAR